MEIKTSSNISSLNNQQLTTNKVNSDKVEVKKTDELSKEEKENVTKLKKEDQRVRTHENAHKSAAGTLSKGSPNYKYEFGPDGKKYAVSGDVHIDSAEVPNDPEATIEKAQKIKRAAMAPADPSSQDQKVASEASRMEAKARQELLKSSDKKSDKNDNLIKNQVERIYSQSENKSQSSFSAIG